MKKLQPPKTPQEQPDPTPQQMREELNMLYREKAQLSQMLWEAVRIAAPETHRLELPQSASDPLWVLAFNAGSGGKMELLAGTHPEITEQEKKRIVRLLRDTTNKIEEAVAFLKLPFPPAYVEQRIADHLTWKDGKWQSVTPPTIGERVKNAVNWPK